MKCEGDFNKCKNKALWELEAFGCLASLFVCEKHKIKYYDETKPLGLVHKIQKIKNEAENGSSY